MGALILDGRALAAARAPEIAERVNAVARRRGRPPMLLIMAFPNEVGSVPHVKSKVRACESAGIVTALLIIEPGSATESVLRRMRDAIDHHDPDGVFVQIPFPIDLDGDVIEAAIPEDLDVDVMTPASYQTFMSGAGGQPPVTVSAALLLLDAHDVAIEGRQCVLVAEPSPFAMMFSEALRRRGARMETVVAADAGDLAEQVGRADLVVAAAGRPGIIPTNVLAPGCVAIDVGYFNEGGRGDIDVASGTAHLGALMPVPGGIGPMTVSALLERVVQFADR